MIIRPIVIVLLSTIGLTPKIYGISINGLKLDSLDKKVAINLPNSEIIQCENLNALLRNATFKKSIIEEISVKLLSVPFDESSMHIDTDNESDRRLEGTLKGGSTDAKLEALSVIRRKNKKHNLNRSRHVGKASQGQSYDLSNNYWKEQYSAIVDMSNKQVLCNKLTLDAFLISESGVADRPGSITCLCVALRDKSEHVKKFVFHNGENLLALNMRKKAEELGYDVIQTEQSHTEGQLIQFLLYRHRKMPGFYTHLLGMGCSRSHCMECDSLLKLYLGDNYHQFTSSINTRNTKKEDIREDHNPDRIHTEVRKIGLTINDAGKPVVSKHIDRTGDVVHGDRALDVCIFKNYYLPLSLKDSIQEKLGVTIIFSGERLTKSKKRTQD